MILVKIETLSRMTCATIRSWTPDMIPRAIAKALMKIEIKKSN